MRSFERDDFVLQVYDLRYTYVQIAEELATRFVGRRVTKRAIRQRVKRLWLAARGKPFLAFRKR